MVFMAKKYAICGLSNRAIAMFIKPMIKTFSSSAELVGVLDSDPRREQILKDLIPETTDVPAYKPDEFDKMVKETNPDRIIVAGRDDTHVDYIVQALAHDLDVITEKPMTTTAADAQRVVDAEKKSKGKVTVTFNYRYAPIHTKIKELI